MMGLRHAFCHLGAFAVLCSTALAQSASARSCDNLPHGDHPQAALGNGDLSAVLFLPDAEKGYYRGSRFDWAGVIGCVAYKGHTYFGEWFPRYDPLLNDAITGPVEEFRASGSELGYDEAAVGGRFLKIGVGVLRKVKDAPYAFGGAYPLVDGGERTMRRSGRSVTFTQVVKTDFGYAYRYEKTVELDRHGAILRLKHRLTNLGSKTIETNVYDHDFFMLDDKPTGPKMVVKLGFAPVPDKPFPSTATIEGNEIVFRETPTSRNSPQGYLTGYSGKSGEYRITVKDRNAHIGVEQISASPLSKFYFWSTPKTICPEAYIAVHVAPRKTQSWEIRYRFLAE